MRFIILILISLTSTAYSMSEREVQLLKEKTFSRDNTFCRINKHSIEIEIRGDERYTEKQEAHFGKYVLQKNEDKSIALPINQDQLGRVRFFHGKNSLCSKSIGFELDNKTSAILFLKENRPFKEKLVILNFDNEKLIAKDSIESNYLTDQALPIKGGFIFKSLNERMDRVIGKVTINGNEYSYQEQDMRPWIAYTSKGFVVQNDESFNRSEFKHFFQNQTDFEMFAGWSKEKKEFLNPHVYTAVNYQTRRECILFTSNLLTNLNGSEFWRCKEMSH